MYDQGMTSFIAVNTKCLSFISIFLVSVHRTLQFLLSISFFSLNSPNSLFLPSFLPFLREYKTV